MGEVFLDAFLDTLKVLPFLLIMNFLIELVEYRTNGLKADKILKGGFAPLIGTTAGVVPQCGFSVVATELYGKRRIALGTLLAVYLATSDEALPIMLSSYEGVTKLLPVLLIKVCFALIVGYSVFGIEKLAGRRRSSERCEDSCAQVDLSERNSVAVDSANGEDGDGETHLHIHGCHRHPLEEQTDGPGDGATKKQKALRMWNIYLKHPLLHTATVLLYILIVNVLFGIVVYYIGEARIAAFIGSTGYLQPLLAAAVGLIPNCAGSVVITELYIVGGLNLGGAVAGLCVSAGIGYAVLIKQNKPIKNTVTVIALMFVLSVSIGLIVNLVAQYIPFL